MRKQMFEPNKDSALYLQIKDILIERIRSGVWKEHMLIPTEKELIDEFNVSRTTIREAISILVQSGLLEKKQGKGTIVKPQKLAGNLGRLKGFAEEVLEMGQVISSKLLRADFRSDLYHEQSMLNVGDEEILLIERIRFADSAPVALERTCWPKEIGEILMKYDLNEARYYDILEEHNYYLYEASERITAINSTILEADLLSSRPGEAMLQMTRLSYGLNKKPIEYTITKYRSDYYQYDIQLKR